MSRKEIAPTTKAASEQFYLINRGRLISEQFSRKGRTRDRSNRSGWRGEGCQGRCLRNGKAAREFTVSHEQTEANPAQPRERLENAGERHLRWPTDCLGKPVRGGCGADERRNAHGRKSRRVIRAAHRR